MMEGKKIGPYKKDFDVAMFFSSQNINFLFLFEETLGDFLFLSLFFQYFFLFFSMLRLFEDSMILMIFEEKDNLRKLFSNCMGWYG
jgi:hypothetical protein